MTVRWGLSLPNRGPLIGATTAEELLQVARAADESDIIDSVWVGDSLLHKPRLEALTTLAVIAGSTRRVRMGTICLATFPLRHPIWLAVQWATLDVLSGGRTVLGACIGGGADWELAPFNVQRAERVPRLREGIAILRRLWTEDKVTFTGRFYRFVDVTLDPKPVQRPCPIWIASNPKAGLAESNVVQRAMRRIGELGDGFMTDAITPQEFAARWSFIRDTAQANGRDTSRMESALHLMVNINADRQAAYQEAKEFLWRYYRFDISRELMELWVAYGPPDEVIAKIRRYVDAGVTTPVLRFAALGQMQQFDRAMRSVLPELVRAA